MERATWGVRWCASLKTCRLPPRGSIRQRTASPRQSRRTAKPEISRDPAAVASAAAGDAFHIVLTYSHALDLAICHRLLSRGDFRFLGLIGSATKRARFIGRLSGLGIAEGQLTRLVCPIGLPGIGGKEPAAIALSIAAQLVQLTAAANARLAQRTPA